MKHLFIYLTVFFSFGKLYANNISVSNVQRAGFDATAKWALVEFDLSWDNSWRTSVGPANWDAAWVFIKFRVGSVDRQMTASSSGTTVTVSSTAGLRVGMPVVVTSGTGAFDTNTVISSIANDSQFVVSETPTTALNGATITCVRIWEHASLDTIDANHVAPNGSTIAVPNDSTGAFIYRSENGYGDFNLADVRLRWKYGSNGLDLDSVDIQVFAIEMVYVPQGSFYVGDGTNTDISGQLESGTSGSPLQITSEGVLTLGGGGTGSLGNNNASGMVTVDDFDDATSKSLSANYPKGYNAFYCMKYEMSQGQYRDFLNTLNRSQQNNRTKTDCAPGKTSITKRYVMNDTSLVYRRQGIRCDATIDPFLPMTFYCDLDADGTYNESNDGEGLSCNYLSWMDVCAFLDWAGLRPMTELEYEKACRGDQAPVANEYAWGTASIASSAYTLSNAGTANEGIATNYSTTAGNVAYSTTDNNRNGPLRGGVFAANGSNNGRISSGAGYYGVMELSGNVWELIVSLGSSDGRSFTGLHGNGSISNEGDANVAQWPGVTDGTGSGARGGGFNSSDANQRLSDRTVASFSTSNRYGNGGFRGVRTAAQ